MPETERAVLPHREKAPHSEAAGTGQVFLLRMWLLSKEIKLRLFTPFVLMHLECISRFKLISCALTGYKHFVIPSQCMYVLLACCGCQNVLC